MRSKREFLRLEKVGSIHYLLVQSINHNANAFLPLRCYNDFLFFLLSLPSFFFFFKNSSLPVFFIFFSRVSKSSRHYLKLKKTKTKRFKTFPLRRKEMRLEAHWGEHMWHFQPFLIEWRLLFMQSFWWLQL